MGKCSILTDEEEESAKKDRPKVDLEGWKELGTGRGNAEDPCHRLVENERDVGGWTPLSSSEDMEVLLRFIYLNPQQGFAKRKVILSRPAQLFSVVEIICVIFPLLR